MGDPPEKDWRKQQLKARLFGEHQTPARIGRFIVLGPLGQGGMGSVLRAYDETLDRQVALKLMHPSVQSKHQDRILREAQALARLSHPNVVQVYEVVELDEQLFIAMELISGQTLQQWQEQERTWRECLEVYIQAGRGLAAAHAAGMIHRDFKPSNCIIDEQGRVRVLDFGLARHTGQSEGDEDDEPEPPVPSVTDPPARGTDSEDPTPLSTSSSMLSKKLTVTGSVLGTVAYMAPEQMRGQAVDARADQFSFCVSLYEAIFGTRPFAPGPGGTLVGTLERVPVARPQRMPRGLVRAIARGFQPDPAARWPSMEALLDALERHRRRSSLRWAGAGVLITTLAGAGLWLTSPPAPPESVPPCREAAAAVAGLWEDEQRDLVREAIFASHAAYAPDAWGRVHAQLDGYVDQLANAHTEACEATKVRFEQTLDNLELRRACLDTRASALHQTVSVLQTADAQVVERAVELVVALPSVTACADMEALHRAAALATQDQGQPHQQQLDALRERLVQARVLQTAGKVAEGLEVIGPVLAAAEQHGDASILAQAHLVQGRLRTDLGQLEEAEQQLRLALHEALEQGADEVVVDVLTTLIYVIGVDRAQPDSGLWLGTMAEGLVDRVDRQGHAKARVYAGIGQVWSARGDYAQAQAQLERALALLRTAVGDDHIDLAEPLDSLGVALRNQGLLDRAQQQYTRALEIRTRWQGELHPTTLHQRINIGGVLTSRGEYEEAERMLRKALQNLTAAPLPRHEFIAHAHTTLGTCLAEQSDWPAARYEFTRAVETWELLHGPTHPRVAKTRYNLAKALRNLNLVQPAIDEFERVLSILQVNEVTPETRDLKIRTLKRLIKQLDAAGRKTEAAVRRAELQTLGAVTPPDPSGP